MGNSVSAGGISGGSSGVGRFNSSLKCSAHLFSCSSTVVSGLPFLSLIGLTDQLTILASDNFRGFDSGLINILSA